ncbi:MAG TPA: tRNA 2-thiouridine(34) synthase MnmA [Lachnospiraceae bacterium]|nr:tRNA 2-thiouridine(34) synthase MnmA [Lachnospiraceae bacterium]
MKNKTVVTGMSGGVDSSVAAYILKEQGYNVIGVTMQIWQDSSVQMREMEGGCCGLSAVEDARRVAEQLNIPYYVMNFKDEFKKKVINYFIEEYRRGYTPNPCIACNKYLKWDALLRRAMEIGADYIATGHYAHIIKLENGRYTVSESAAGKKDQTYVLYNLSQYQLMHTLMPDGAYNKEEIRAIAQKAGLNVAHKSESQDICFVPDHDYVGFIERETGVKCRMGNFVDEDGNVLGIHKGIEHYTIGQRKGLGLPAKQPYFVKEIRPETREIVLGDARSVFTNIVYADNINYMAVEKLTETRRLKAKIRYSHAGAECEVTPFSNGRLMCRFDEKQRAVTPGQAVVFYDNGYIFGGGRIIAENWHSNG